MHAAIPRPKRPILADYSRMDATANKTNGGTGEEAQVAASLVARIALGDRAAENELVERYSRGVLFMLKRRSNGDTQLAEDVHQEVFRIVIERLRATGIEDARKLAGFIHSTGRNVLIGVLRKRQRRATYADSDVIAITADESNTQIDTTIQDERATEVRRLLAELSSDRDRALLTRYFLQQEDKHSICEALELTDLHFNRVLYRAKKRFRALIESHEQPAARELADGC